MVLFVAALHLALGYGLAVYLGYAPLGSTAWVSSATTILSPFDHETVISDNLDEPRQETVVENDGIEEATSESSLVKDKPLVKDDMTQVEDKPEAVSPSTLAEAATLFEEMIRLRTASAEMRSNLVEIANWLWGSSEESRVGQDVFARLNSSLSEVIQKLDFESPLRIDRSNPQTQHIKAFLAARRKLWQRLSVAMDRTKQDDANDDEAYRQTLRNAVLDAYEAAYEVDAAIADIHARVWNETDGITDEDQDPLAGANMQRTGHFDMVRSLKEFWSTEGEKRPLAAAMLDVDHCRRLNCELGPTRCDCLIDHVAEIVKHTIPNPCALGRFSGQRLFVLIPDKLPNSATDEIEQARETIAKTTFATGTVKQTMTLTCAIAEAMPDERPETLFQRLAETLQEAKRYGRNRTFLHEGDYPAPVVPAHLDVESRVVELA